jgi:hypothetical protein
VTVDWRLPENRREAFQRSYTFSLEYQNFPGMVYSMLPAIADHYGLDDDGRAWLAWLNGNTQNVVTSMLLLEAAPTPWEWPKAVAFFNEHFKALEWDTDRRHQKAAFPKATEKWVGELMNRAETPASAWLEAAANGWESCWKEAIESPYMGRISAWSYMEFARILLPYIPDVGSWFLEETSSRSHRNALCLLSGFDDAWGWDREQADTPFLLDLFPALHGLAEDLLAEAEQRNVVCVGGDGRLEPYAYEPHPLVSRLTLESALCTFKSWHKPDRRYPNVYADMMYQRIKKAETRMGRKLDLLWEIRQNTLPSWARVEDNPLDPGLSPIKQNCYRETGQIPYLWRVFDDMQPADFESVRHAPRKDPKW